MSLQRRVIRRAAFEHLAGKTDAGKSVFRSRSSDLWSRVELPAICIYCAREVITLEQEAPRRYRRELELRIEAGVEAKSDEDADDKLDVLGWQIENCIGRSNRLEYAKENAVAELYLSGEAIEIAKEGARVVGSMVIVYTAVYYTDEPDLLDPQPLDDLKRIDTAYDLNGRQQPTERAADIVKVET